MNQMKAKDTLLFNNKITQNLILARRAWFWHIAHLIMDSLALANLSLGPLPLFSVPIRRQNAVLPGLALCDGLTICIKSEEKEFKFLISIVILII